VSISRKTLLITSTSNFILYSSSSIFKTLRNMWFKFTISKIILTVYLIVLLNRLFNILV